MEQGSAPPGGDGGEGPSSSSSAAVTTDADAAATPPSLSSSQQHPPSAPKQQQLSRYDSQKRRDWNTFLQYLKNHKPPLTLARCSGAHVIEFLKYLDQFGKTKVHAEGCAHFGDPNPPATCACPLRQAWGSLDALIGRLRAAYEENGGQTESNPFAAKAVRIYLREVRESQAKARGIPYEKKKRKRPPSSAAAVVGVQPVSGGEGSSGGDRDSSSVLPAPADVSAGTSRVAFDSTSGGGTPSGGAGSDGGGASAPATGEETDTTVGGSTIGF